jgi:hypothetical protein
VGWWAGLAWAGVAYLFSLTVVGLPGALWTVVGLPLGLMMFNQLSAILTLKRAY